MSIFKKASKKQAKLRMAIDGPAGSGKTFTSLKLATILCPPGKRVRVIDTERGSASKYADLFDFDVAELAPPYTLQRYVDAINAAGKDEETGVLVIDSGSHAWSGEGGALEVVDAAERKGKNKFTAWRDVTPLHNRFIDSMLGAPCHVIMTMRTKTEYIMETNEKGKVVPKKVGTKPIQRDGMEYEFDVVLDMDHENNGVVAKTRCHLIAGRVFPKPGAELAGPLGDWLADGEKVEVIRKVDEHMGLDEEAMAADAIARSITQAPNVDQLYVIHARMKAAGLDSNQGLMAMLSARKAELNRS